MKRILFPILILAVANPLKAEESPICADLYKAACLDANGRSKYEGVQDQLNEKIDRIMNDARDKTARRMGYRSFDDLLKSKLGSAGLHLREPVDLSEWRDFKLGTDSMSQNAHTMFAESGECRKDFAGLSNDNARLATLKSKYYGRTISLFAKNLDSFMEYLSRNCQLLRDDPNGYDRAKNQRAVETCENLSHLKKEVERLESERVPDREKRAESLVRKNSFELKALGASNSSLVETAPCGLYENALVSVARKTLYRVSMQVDQSKPTIDTIMDAFYSERQKRKVDQSLNDIRSYMGPIIGNFVSSDTKRRAIMFGYETLKAIWPRTPPDSLYKTNSAGILALDEAQRAFSNASQERGNSPYSLFGPMSSSHFKDLQAVYRSRPTGQTTSDTVFISSSLVLAFVDNPFALIGILAHETGHRIDLRTGPRNGFDLRSEFQPLIECYQSTDSLQLRPNQKDEAIADYISSEVLTRKIASLPPQIRRKALTDAMAPMCMMSCEAHKQGGPAVDAAHPEHSLRMNWIFGANPNLRKIIGCDPKPANYRACGWPDSQIGERVSSPVQAGTTRNVK